MAHAAHSAQQRNHYSPSPSAATALVCHNTRLAPLQTLALCRQTNQLQMAQVVIVSTPLSHGQRLPRGAARDVTLQAVARAFVHVWCS